MNERQRDPFLWLWSRRRAPGQAAIAVRGAVIGGLGGALFALIMVGAIETSASGYTGLSVIIPLIERGGMMFMLSVAAFGFLGFVLANRVFAAQEAMYQAMLESGTRVPDERPAMRPADRWPALAVGVAAAVIAGFILYLFMTLG